MGRAAVSGFPNGGPSSGCDVTATGTALLITGLGGGRAAWRRASDGIIPLLRISFEVAPEEMPLLGCAHPG